MYKFDKNHQFGLADFNQPMGLKMNPENRWVKKAETIPWEAIEEKYAALFPSKKGMPAKPLRTALGSLLIQKQLQFSDRELVEEIRENPYFQYFIGLPGYQDAIPFVPSLLVEFRKRLTAEVLGEINEMIIAYNAPDDPSPTGGSDDNEERETNSGTLILDATCAPQNISYPQDVNLLNEAREKLESHREEEKFLIKHYFGNKPKLIGVFCTFIRGQVDYTNEIKNLKNIVNNACEEDIYFFEEEINNYIDIARSIETGEASKARNDYEELTNRVLERVSQMENDYI